MSWIVSGALAVLLSGAALALVAFDYPRLAIATVAASVLLLVHSFSTEARRNRP